MSCTVTKFDALKSWNIISLKAFNGILIVLNPGGLFQLNVEINGKTSSISFSFGSLSPFWVISRAFLIPLVIILVG